MATTIDPAGIELRALVRAAHFPGARVLEIGSGTGRLAFRAASVARTVVGLESFADDVAFAVRSCPGELRDRVRFVHGSGTALPFRSGSFDLPHEGMVDALRDAWRVLTNGGMLIDLRPRVWKYPLELVTSDAAVPVGYTDTTSRAADDVAADAAIVTALTKGWFTAIAQDAFEVEIVWDSVDDLASWAATRQSTRVSPSFDELERLYRRAATGHRYLRSFRRMILGSYARRQV
jgi:ubiquinone/menaquinone biosynthesis C-methylase UbiE